MGSVITIAGEKLFAAKAQANQQLDIDTFIFANVPGQDPTAPIDREEPLPPQAQIVHQQVVQQVGRINENVVVYSTVLDSVTGPFEFNWVGLYSSVNQTLVAINHVPTVAKTVTGPGVAGNTLNRNFGIEYSGIADLTGITVAPETWQLDFTARLSGMDELTRQLAADMNGKDWFIGDGFKVVPRATANSFSVTPGVGYVSGLRIELEQEHIINVQTYPQFVYVDAWFAGDANSMWKPQIAFTVSDTEMDDYIDVQGVQHYVYKISKLNEHDDIEDLRINKGILGKLKKVGVVTTVKEIESGKFSENEILIVSDRNNQEYIIKAGGVENGKNILFAGENKTAVATLNSKIETSSIGDERNVTEVANHAISILKVGESSSYTSGGVVVLDCKYVEGTEAIKVDRGSSGGAAIGFEGLGQTATLIDMSNGNSLDGLISEDSYTYGSLKDFGLVNSRRNSLNLSERYSRLLVSRVLSSNAGESGFRFGNAFVSEHNMLISLDSGGIGIEYMSATTSEASPGKQHTSHTINSPYSVNSGSHGIQWGQMNYSVTNAAASDANDGYGHLVTRSESFLMNAPGAEFNALSAIGVLSSSQIGETTSMTIKNAFSYKNNLANQYSGNLLHVKALDSVKAHVKLENSKSIPNDGNSNPDVVVEGDGAIVKMGRQELPNGWETLDFGYVDWEHDSFVQNQFFAGKSEPIANLKSTQGHKVRYAGEITVVASDKHPYVKNRDLAIYKIMVCKSISGGNQVLIVNSLGPTNGAVPTSPSFDFSLVNDQLVATTVGETTGGFYFEITTDSQIVASRI
ncbi:TPA: phage tail protein [Shewanella algae]|nr:phage tail protein [Shewanella algae]